MQGTGYVVVEGQKILVLFRDSKTCRWLRIRKGGQDGSHLSDEEDYLNHRDGQKALARLKEGKTVPI